MTTEFVGPVTLPSGATTQGRIRVSAANPLPVTGAITGTVTATADAQANAADQAYTEGSTNPLSTDLAGYLRAKVKQSGAWTVGLDQSTPGTTNAVDVTNLPFALEVNSGNKSNSTIRVVLATDQPGLTNAQPANIAQVAGSAVAANGANVAAGNLPVAEVDGFRVAAASVTSATTVIGPFDTQGFSSGMIDATSIGSSCTIILEGSNDNSTFFQQPLQTSQASSGSFSPASITNAQGYAFACLFRYYRVRVSVYGSGTITCGAYLRKTANPTHIAAMLTGPGGNFAALTLSTNSFNNSGSVNGLAVANIGSADASATLATLSAAGAGTVNGSDQVNLIGPFLNLGITLTTMTTASIVVTIQGKDAVSGTYYTILQSAALTGTGFTLLSIGPGLTAAANSVANACLPRTWRVQVAISNNGGSAAVTGTIGASIVN